MQTLRLPLANPSPVFGLALLLVVLLLAPPKYFSARLLACVALVHHPASTRLDFAHFKRKDAEHSNLWYLVSPPFFTIFPIYFSSARQIRSQEYCLCERGTGRALILFSVYDVVRAIASETAECWVWCRPRLPFLH